MSTSDRSVSDPVGFITDLVVAVDDRLALERARSVVTSVAGGRSKSRRLAGFLAERPAVLTDGRSPAPRVVGDLLIALRKAGVGRFPRRSAPSAPSRCGPCSVVVRIGTAGPAACVRRPSRRAGSFDMSRHGIAPVGPAARDARTAMIVIRSRSSTTWLPGWIRLWTATSSPPRSAGLRPGLRINAGSRGR